MAISPCPKFSGNYVTTAWNTTKAIPKHTWNGVKTAIETPVTTAGGTLMVGGAGGSIASGIKGNMLGLLGSMIGLLVGGVVIGFDRYVADSPLKKKLFNR